MPHSRVCRPHAGKGTGTQGFSTQASPRISPNSVSRPFDLLGFPVFPVAFTVYPGENWSWLTLEVKNLTQHLTSRSFGLPRGPKHHPSALGSTPGIFEVWPAEEIQETRPQTKPSVTREREREVQSFALLFRCLWGFGSNLDTLPSTLPWHLTGTRSLQEETDLPGTSPQMPI